MHLDYTVDLCITQIIFYQTLKLRQEATVVGTSTLFKPPSLKSVSKCLLHFGLGFDIIVFVSVSNTLNY